MSNACPSVTVSIVSHGQWGMVRPLIDELHAYCRSSVARIVVTLNIPEDAQRSAAWDLPIEFIRNPSPRGFGANHNQAFALCATPWFLVLNPDIRLSCDVLSQMLSEAHSCAGLLTPRIQEPGKPGPEPYRGLLTPAELFLRRRKGHRPPAVPAWVAGMFMLVRTAAFKQVEGFDERYFMYCEDVDLCARLRLSGWDLQPIERLTVTHEAQRASNSAITPLRWHLASLVRLWTSPAFWRYATLLHLRKRATNAC